MMLTFIFALPVLAAVACLALDRLVGTRLLGFGGAFMLAVCAVLLASARSSNELVLVNQPWMTVENQTIQLGLGLNIASSGVALLLFLGGAVSLLALALALPRTLRRYGGLVATLLLLVEGSLLGLATGDMVLLPVAWAALPVLAFTALRASGGQNEAQSLPIGLLANLLGAVVLLGAALQTRFAATNSAPELTALALLFAGMLALGLPPFHRSIADVMTAPANVAAPLIAFGLPLLGGYVLIDFAASTSLSRVGEIAFQVVGLAAVLICGAAALRERRLRRLIGWQTSAQFGMLVSTLGVNRVAAGVVGPALLFNIAVVTCTSLLAVGIIERRAGSDSLDAIKLGAPVPIAGAALLIAAASAIGVPGTWGFWPLRWLIDGLVATQSTRLSPLLGPLLGGITLLALGWVAPLVSFLRVPKLGSDPQPGASVFAQFCPLLAVVPLLVFGIAPQVWWNSWGSEAFRQLLGRVRLAEFTEPAFPDTLGSVILIAAVLLLGLIILGLRRMSVRRTPTEAEIEPSGVITPDGLGESLAGVSWFGAPSVTFVQLWQGITAVSRGLGRLLGVFEQRYFMAGLMLALVAVVLLLLQG